MVPRWDPINPQTIMRHHPVLYDSPNELTRVLVPDLSTYPEKEDDGETERRVYTPDGVQVPRRKPRGLRACDRGAMLQNLSCLHTLFAGPAGCDDDDSDMDEEFELDEEEIARSRARSHDVSYTSYPHMFSKNIGQWQANGIIRPMVPHIQRLSKTLTQPGSGGQALTGMNSQCYNSMSHRMRVSKRHHLAQRGVLTGAAAGPWATTPTAENTAWTLFGQADIGLPHERMANQLATGPKTFLRLENNFLIYFTHLKDRYRSGSALYTHFVVPYERICLRADVIDPLRAACVVFRDEVCVRSSQRVCFAMSDSDVCLAPVLFEHVRLVWIPRHRRYGPDVEGSSRTASPVQRAGHRRPCPLRRFGLVSGHGGRQQLTVQPVAPQWGCIVHSSSQPDLRRRHQRS